MRRVLAIHKPEKKEIIVTEMIIANATASAAAAVQSTDDPYFSSADGIAARTQNEV